MCSAENKDRSVEFTIHTSERGLIGFFETFDDLRMLEDLGREIRNAIEGRPSTASPEDVKLFLEGYSRFTRGDVDFT